MKKIAKDTRENAKVGVKNGCERVTLHVKKCKKRSKIGFLVHFRFHAKKKKHWAQIVHVKKEFQHVKILRNIPVKMIFVRVKKYQKKPVSARENDNLGVKKVKKVRKSERETLTLHVKKCKKRSKISFHAHFRFHAQKNKH